MYQEIFNKTERPGRVAQSVARLSDSRARGPGFDIQSGQIPLFLPPLIQEGQYQLLAKECARSTGESLRPSMAAQEKCG